MKRFYAIAFLTVITMAFSTGQAAAQYYEHSAGIRLGGSYGFTYKTFFDEQESIELLLGGRNDGLHLTGTFQFNRPLNLSKNETFFFYYGGGAHAGYEKYPTKVIDTVDPTDPGASTFRYENQNYFTMGIDLIVGIEYRFLTAPITIGLDIKPYFSYIGFRYTRSQFWDTSLSVKYVF